MNMTIALILTIILFIAAILRNIDWRAKAVKWVGNNPARSRHYISAGDTIHSIEGKRILMAAEGMTYCYEDMDKVKYIVDIPENYPYKYILGQRVIGQSDGQLVPDPLGFMRPEEISKVHEGLTNISHLTQGGVAVALVHSIKSNKMKSSIIWILVIAAVVGAGYFWYSSHNKPAVVLVNTANVTSNVTTSQSTIGTVVPIGNGGTITVPPVERVTP